MGAYCYAVTNALNGLAAAAFTFSAGLNDSTRTRLNDGWMDNLYVNGAAVASGLTVIIDFGAATTLTGFALLNHNAAVQKTDAAVKVEADTGAGFGTAVTAKAATTLDSTAPRNKDHVLQFAAVTKRYWRLTFTWTGTVTNFAIGELFAFNAQVQLSRKSIYGGGERPQMKIAAIDFYSGGRQAYFLGGPVRVLRLPFSDLNPTARAELLTLWTAVRGGVTPFLWIPSYEATATAAAVDEQEVVYGLLGPQDLDLTEADYLLYNSSELEVRSLGREVGS